ncbi:FAD-binding domain-containing protein [Moniliophthora roreri MCA 2997]|uniref:FAD-binding domain-containing protein n=1 Tax=Moniliophthora roreri (strain MCA 2997) TaxID=1381753 RepID=V2WWA1_MONRO|nr:FAD-binding domain-containing protein [Moniliophthora roreri MCA 2997]
MSKSLEAVLLVSVLVASYWAEVSVISTDQYGLAIDIIVAHDLALPDGISVVVTGASDPDLSFVLKGSFNDFDTVTAFTLKTHPPADIWISVQSLKRIVCVHQSAAKWSANDDDHEAVVIPFYAYGSGQVCISSPSHATIPTALSVVIGNEPILFYYAPMQSSIFDQFTNAPGAVIQVSGVMSLTEASYAISGQVDRITLVRGSKHTIPNTKYTVTILDEMKTQLEDTTSDAQTKDRPLLGAYFAAEPYSQSNVQSADSVYPHPQGRFVRPRLIDVISRETRVTYAKATPGSPVS